MRKSPLIKTFRSSAAAGVLGVALLSAPAFAQADNAQSDTQAPVSISSDQDQGPTSDQAPADIVVTGSRIPQPNLESVAPITVVTSQDLKLQGTTRVEDLLNSLPSVFASQSSTLANGADGTASVDLRGLGSTRTLVLVNGRRLLPGDPSPTSGSAADINIIPAALLKRVEVLTGGASSTYGADAVAGVVNFIMDTSFTGVRLDGQYSGFQHTNGDKFLTPLLDASEAGAPGFDYPHGNSTDGGAVDATLSIGAGFDDGRGHITAYVGYRKINPVLQGNRDYAACTLQNSRAGAPVCGGSATSDNGNAILFHGGTSTIYTFQPGGGFANQTSLYNFAPTNYYQRPDERYTAGFFANYEINDTFKPYAEFMFMDDRTVAQIAPSGDFGNTLTINSDNPLISQAQRDIIFAPENLINGQLGTFPLAAGAAYNTGAPGSNTPGPGGAPTAFTDPTTGATYNKAFFQLLRRNVEGGPRQSDLQHTNFRTVVGTKGDLGKAWSYDAYYQFGRTNYSQVYTNEFSVARLQRALDVVAGPGGTPICRSVRDGTDPNCVPYNIFNGRGTASPASINYLSATGFQRGETTEQIADVSFTGQLGEYGVKSPWAADGVAVNLGFEWRNESLDLQTDQEFQTGDLTGQGGATLPLSGSFRVYELFGEANIPIIQDGFVKDFSFTTGYRRSWYKTSADNSYNTDTYKFGVDFAPISDIRFRASYNRAVRAPNIQELFATNTVALDGAGDPCSGRVITTTDYGCIAQGLAAGRQTPSNPAGQYNGLVGGNTDLQPEIATTKSVGVVFQPRFVPHFALTVDYFDIKIDNAIRQFGEDAILNDCNANSTAAAAAASCGLVHRDTAGSLWLTSNGYVTDTPGNVGQVQTKGIEVNSTYSHDIGAWGRLSASFIGTYLDSYKVNNGLTDPYDCAGLYGPTCSGGGTTESGAPLPRWRHKARLTWDAPKGFGLSLQWRYIGPVTAETTSDNPSLHGDFNFDPGLRIHSYSYFDLAATYSMGSKYNLRLGVNNIADIQPPYVTSGSGSRAGSNLCPTGPCNGNTYPAVYDALGRYLYVGMTLDF